MTNFIRKCTPATANCDETEAAILAMLEHVQLMALDDGKTQFAEVISDAIDNCIATTWCKSPRASPEGA